MELIADRADDLYLQVLAALLDHGRSTAPRGKRTLELVAPVLRLTNPYRNIITLPERALSYPFMVAEWLWITQGMNDLAMLKPYNKVIAAFSDDGETLRGAYGPKLIEQLPYIIDTLRVDPFSRQAVLTIWRERPGPSKDIPCTVAIQFLLRNSGGVAVLDMITTMRSNDAWLGLPYDLFTFTMLQQHVAAKLDAVCGVYHHIPGSLHLYELDAEKAALAIDSGHNVDIIRDWVTEGMTPLEAMPGAFRAMYLGLTLLSKHAEANEELIGWLKQAGTLPDPWNHLLSLLGYRFHKDHSLLLPPWDKLVPNNG